MGKKWRRLIGAFVIIVLGFTVWEFYKSREAQKLIDEIKEERSSDIVFGDIKAKNNVIIFFDYNCGFCNKFMAEVYPRLKETVLKNSDAKITLRLVCRTTDVKATEAYQTAICLNQAGDYMKLHKLLMHKPEVVYTEYFNQIKEDYIVSNDILAECIMTSENQDIKHNIYQFQQLKTKGTPTFVVGTKVIKGLKGAETFKNIIESEFN